VARWEPYISTEPSIVLARALRTLAPPGGVTLSLEGDVLVATGRAPAIWITRAESLAPALAGIGAIDVSRVTPGLPAEMESLATAIERRPVLFAAGTDALDEAALATTVAIASQFNDLLTAARTHRYQVALQIVGRADPTGSERDNLALSRRRADAVRDRLVALGVTATQIVVGASGSNDPLPADSPAEHARLNRSASFVVQARPAANANGPERQR
jgi:outer membrane protein OmpA-like peptidoglycan-associated protein